MAVQLILATTIHGTSKEWRTYHNIPSGKSVMVWNTPFDVSFARDFISELDSNMRQQARVEKVIHTIRI